MTPIFKTSLGVIVAIFFFNRFLLPFNLQVTLLLTPFLFYYLVKYNYHTKLIIPIAVFTLFCLSHLVQGVVFKDFFISALVGLFLIVFIFAFRFFYKNSKQIPQIIQLLTQLNFIFTLFALLSLFSGWFLDVFWYLVPFTVGYEAIPRLKLFQLEASHYSLALMPLFFYYFWRVFKHFVLLDLVYLLTLSLSLLLSFSLGVLAVIAFALLVVFVANMYRISRASYSRNFVLVGLLGVILSMGFLYLFYPDNPLYFRLSNLFNGDDTSGRGRTYEALEIGWEVLFNNNPLTGIGLGQFKIIGRETLLQYYHYTVAPEVARLPNAIAETLVSFGLLGLIVRLGLQVFFFVKFKVYNNLFQFSLFTALFVYQFTGSYLFNSMEYVIWIMAFCSNLSFYSLSKYFAK